MEIKSISNTAFGGLVITLVDEDPSNTMARIARALRIHDVEVNVTPDENNHSEMQKELNHLARLNGEMAQRILQLEGQLGINQEEPTDLFGSLEDLARAYEVTFPMQVEGLYKPESNLPAKVSDVSAFEAAAEARGYSLEKDINGCYKSNYLHAAWKIYEQVIVAKAAISDEQESETSKLLDEARQVICDIQGAQGGGDKSCGHEFYCICPWEAARKFMNKTEK